MTKKSPEDEKSIETPFGLLFEEQIVTNFNLDDDEKKKLDWLFQNYLSVKEEDDQLVTERDIVEERIATALNKVEQLDDLRKELEAREKQIAGLTGYHLDDLDEMRNEPMKFGHFLKSHHYLLLKQLTQSDGLTLMEMSSLLHKHFTTVFRTLRVLDISLGYVRRQEDKPADRFFITDAGRLAVSKYEGKTSE